MPCWVNKQDRGLQETGDLPFALLGITEAAAGAPRPVLRPALPAEPSPVRCPREAGRPLLRAELLASEEEGLDALPGEESSSEGKVEGSSLSLWKHSPSLSQAQ